MESSKPVLLGFKSLVVLVRSISISEIVLKIKIEKDDWNTFTIPIIGAIQVSLVSEHHILVHAVGGYQVFPITKGVVSTTGKMGTVYGSNHDNLFFSQTRMLGIKKSCPFLSKGSIGNYRGVQQGGWAVSPPFDRFRICFSHNDKEAALLNGNTLQYAQLGETYQQYKTWIKLSSPKISVQIESNPLIASHYQSKFFALYTGQNCVIYKFHSPPKEIRKFNAPENALSMSLSLDGNLCVFECESSIVIFQKSSKIQTIKSASNPIYAGNDLFYLESNEIVEHNTDIRIPFGSSPPSYPVTDKSTAQSDLTLKVDSAPKWTLKRLNPGLGHEFRSLCAAPGYIAGGTTSGKVKLWSISHLSDKTSGNATSLLSSFGLSSSDSTSKDESNQNLCAIDTLKNLDHGKCDSFSSPSHIYHLEFLYLDGKPAFLVSGTRFVRVWKIPSMSLVQTIKTVGLTSLNSIGSNFMYTSKNQLFIMEYTGSTWIQKKSFSLQCPQVHASCVHIISKNSFLYAYASYDSKDQSRNIHVCKCSLTYFKQLHIFKNIHSTYVKSICFSPNGCILFTSGFDGVIRSFSLQEWKPRNIFLLKNIEIQKISLSSPNSLFVCGSTKSFHLSIDSHGRMSLLNDFVFKKTVYALAVCYTFSNPIWTCSSSDELYCFSGLVSYEFHDNVGTMDTIPDIWNKSDVEPLPDYDSIEEKTHDSSPSAPLYNPESLNESNIEDVDPLPNWALDRKKNKTKPEKKSFFSRLFHKT